MVLLDRGRCLEVDVIAKRYGVLPSAVIASDVNDFALDLCVTRAAIKNEMKQAEKQQKQAKRGRR